ncbi:MAG: helicase-related protein [Thermoanaerobaculia bacterium]
MATALRPAFKRNDKLLHRFNLDLGPGRVEEVEGRRIVVHFPKTGTRLTLAGDDAALRPLVLVEGQRARIEATNEEVIVAEKLDDSYRLADGRLVADKDIWPLVTPDDPLDRLAALEIDRAAAFRNRLDGMFIQRLRQAKGLGSFLGGRIQLYPHQLYVAERAAAADPVRWLLADEVGLGKTIEACLILSRLLRTDRADRTLVIAPSTLTVQWLGELYRKFHQTFVLLDKKRREDVATDHGADFNPFEAHRRSVIALEDLISDPRLVAHAVEAGLDLLVVDEAHRLERGPDEPGNDAYRAVAPLAGAARHLLLLSATPLEADTHGFFRLLELVRPDAYRSEEEFLSSLEEGRPLPPCTSATRRVDIGGLPPRVPLPVDLDRAPLQERLSGDEKEDAEDPRIEWLVRMAPAFARGGAEEGKTLVFCHERDTLTALKARLESATRRRIAIFHEELTPERRDMEVAEFRRAEGPVFLISTECGGEGRNFEFCRRLILFDLPTDPARVEQRIGRLDRINRTTPVEVVYFRPPEGFGAELVELYERIGLFREPLGGLERSLSHVEEAIQKAQRFARRGVRMPVDEIAAEVRAAAELRQTAVFHHLHAGGYRAEEAAGIRARIPKELDTSMERFVREAADLFGFDTAARPGVKTWYIEFGSDALLEHLPGVAGGSRYLGTFSRDEAVAREELDFFASGHALVEGIFQELEDGARGRSALLRLEHTGQDASGLFFLIQSDAGFQAVAIGLDGKVRRDWAELLLKNRSVLHGLRAHEWLAGLKGQTAVARDWPTLCRELATRVRKAGRVLSAAGFRLYPGAYTPQKNGPAA